MCIVCVHAYLQLYTHFILTTTLYFADTHAEAHTQTHIDIGCSKGHSSVLKYADILINLRKIAEIFYLLEL